MKATSTGKVSDLGFSFSGLRSRIEDNSRNKWTIKTAKSPKIMTIPEKRKIIKRGLTRKVGRIDGRGDNKQKNG